LKKIYFIRANKTKFGGAEVYLSRLSNALDARNVGHEIINSSISKILPSWIRAILFNIQVCFSKGNKFYFSLERVSCPDIYRAGDGVHKVFLRKINKSKVNLLHPTYLFLEKRCFKHAKRIIANSQMVRNQIINNFNIDPNKVSVIYNGIEFPKTSYHDSFKHINSEFFIKKDSPVFLYVGSGFERKGVKEFIEILSKIENKNFTAFIVGKDKKISEYINLVIDYGLDSKVIFTGPRDDVQHFYEISDVFILPTHYEPFSNVVLEAMYQKNIVFTTVQNGASEVLKERFIMSSPGDVSIAETINEILEDKDLMQKLKIENFHKAKEFSIDRNLRETYSLINETID